MTFWRTKVIAAATLAALFADLAWAKEKPAPAAARPTVTPAPSKLALADVLKTYRERASLSPFKGALAARVTAQEAVDTRLFQGPWTFGISGEKAITKGGDTKLDLVAKRRLGLGVDREAVSRRYEAESKSALLSKQLEAREQELEVAKLFGALRQKQEATAVNEATLALLEPLERKAKAASQLGTLGGFFATRLKLTVDSIRADLLLATHAYALQARTLSDLSGAAISTDPKAVQLLGREVTSEELPEVSEATFLPAASTHARQEALAAQATQLAASWDVETGLGLTRNFETKTSGILFQIDIPLGTASAAQSQVQSLASEQALLKAEGDYALARAKDQEKILKTNIARLVDAHNIEGTRIVDLEQLLGKAQAAFRNGQGDLSEIIETAKELHDAKIKSTELRADLEEAHSTLDFFVRGDLP